MLPILILLNIVIAIQQEPPFKEQVVDDNISIGYGLAIGDVDGDKKPDILLADKKQIVWYRNGDWKKFVIAENLTESDNVCIAARDLNNDGKVEIAVGAQWNPGETSDDKLSGAVFYLNRPADINQPWEAIRLHHEPTVHRMRWVKDSKGKFFLVMLPLHGRDNKGGEGVGVKVIAYEFPKDVRSKWSTVTIADEMHMTHNMDIKEQSGKKTEIYVAGREGVKVITEPFTEKKTMTVTKIDGKDHASGEIRLAKNFIVTIQPMHGNKVSLYPERGERIILDSSLADGHAIGVADFSNHGYEQIVAGWRNPDKDNLVGIKLYTRKNGAEWTSEWIDKNGMACEDLQVADLNGDGKADIIAAGRSTKNLKIYWNK